MRLRDKKKKVSIGQQRGRTFVQKADLTNASCLLVYNLNEIMGETGVL